MANLFDSTNYPNVEPETLTVGDRWVWKRDDLASDYPLASYALSYEARLQGAGSPNFTLAATESGSEYLIEIPSVNTASLTAGTYNWNAFITRSSDNQRIEIASGIWEILANLATSTADPRDHDEKMVDYLKATLESLAQKLTDSYSVSDRSNTLKSMDDVRTQLDFYEGKVKSKINKTRAEAGQRTDQNILLRFNGF